MTLRMCNVTISVIICHGTLLSVGWCSVVSIVTCYGLDGLGIKFGGRGGDEIFCFCPDQPWGSPASSTVGTESFPERKWLGYGIDHPPPSHTEVKEIVVLYLYSPSGPSLPVLGWTLPLPLPLYCWVADINTFYFLARLVGVAFIVQSAESVATECRCSIITCQYTSWSTNFKLSRIGCISCKGIVASGLQVLSMSLLPMCKGSHESVPRYSSWCWCYVCSGNFLHVIGIL
jgi:hypothetical protein